MTGSRLGAAMSLLNSATLGPALAAPTIRACAEFGEGPASMRKAHDADRKVSATTLNRRDPQKSAGPGTVRGKRQSRMLICHLVVAALGEHLVVASISDRGLGGRRSLLQFAGGGSRAASHMPALRGGKNGAGCPRSRTGPAPFVY